MNHAMIASRIARLPLIDALRALMATLVAWHHFILYYPGLSGQTTPLPEGLVSLLRDYRSAVQMFFVVGGYAMARSMSRHRWDRRQVGLFVLRRYCRLGLPYLAAVALAILAALAGRHWLAASVVGPAPTLDQVFAHVVFLQDILGYDSLSAGLWFVCIDFQLGLIFVVMLSLRDFLTRRRASPESDKSTAMLMLLGWPLAAASMFFFNLDERWNVWAIYFFGQFFLGVVVYHGLNAPAWRTPFWLYQLLMIAALAVSWRWRLATAALVGGLLYGAGRAGLMQRWPSSRVIAGLGRSSYSLFLVHYPVLLIVASLWASRNWDSRSLGLACLVSAYAVSLAVAEVFFRTVEAPAERLGHKFK